MRVKYLDAALAQTLAWIWLAVLVAGGVAWLIHRHWRARHPIPRPEPVLRYSQRLQQRLAKTQVVNKRKASKRPATSHQRRD
jgi:hypothetical protein